MIEYNLMQLGNRLKAIRAELNLSQKEVALKTSIPASTLSGIETGKNKAGYDFFYKIAKELNVNLYYLVFGEGEVFGHRGMMSSLGGKEIGQPIESMEELNWYMENSTILRFQTLGFVSRFIVENSDLLKKEMKVCDSDNSIGE